MDHAKGCVWLLQGGVMCACDQCGSLLYQCSVGHMCTEQFISQFT